MSGARSSCWKRAAAARILPLAAAGLLIVLARPALPAAATSTASPCRVTLTAPRDTDVLYGPTEIVAEASCPEETGAVEVMLLVDGQVVARVARPPYRALWDAGGSFAAHLVAARLVDRQGRTVGAALATQASALRESVRVTSTPIDRVELSVSVTDREGRPLRDLVAGDFVVRESGRAQIVDGVEPERRPLSVAVLVDVSSSTRELWPHLTRAAPAFARTLGPQDVAKVVAFSGPAYLVQDFTHDARAIAASMSRLRQWGGGTSLYDTLASAGVELAWGLVGRQAVILMTDGIDTLSRIDAPRLRNYLRRTDVAVETLLLRPPGSTSYPGYGRFVRDIEVLSRETGGSVRQLRDLSQMETAFRELGEGLQNRYHVTYHSDRVVRAGAWRSIDVRVKRRGAAVRTRGGVLSSRDIVDYLLQDLRAGDAASRRKAAEWLGSIGPRAPAEPLLQALTDGSSEVRAAAATSLGQIRDPRAIPGLVRLLGEPDEKTGRAASEALQGFGPAAVEELLAVLERGGPGAQMKALRTLAEIGDARATGAMTRLALPPPPATAAALEAAREAGAPRATDPRVRAWALWSLATMGRPDSVPILSRAAADRDPGLRQVTMRALAELGTLEALPLLARGAVDETPEVRQEALESLERMLKEGAEGIVTRSAGLAGPRLGRVADGALEPLIAVIESPGAPARRQAIACFALLSESGVLERGLAGLAADEARGPLLDRWRGLRDRAVDGLGGIAYPPPGAGPEGDGLDLIPAGGDGDDLRAAALGALGASGSPVAVVLILGGLAETAGAGDDREARGALVRLTGESFARQAAEGFSGRPRQRGAELGRAVLSLALVALERPLGSGAPARRLEAARALGESRRPEAIPALRQAAAPSEPDPMVRAEALQALEIIRRSAAAPSPVTASPPPPTAP